MHLIAVGIMWFHGLCPSSVPGHNLLHPGLLDLPDRKGHCRRVLRKHHDVQAELGPLAEPAQDRGQLAVELLVGPAEVAGEKNWEG